MNARRALLGLVTVGLLFVPAHEPPPLRSGAYVQAVGVDRASVLEITRDPVVRELVVRGPGGERTLRDDAPRRRHRFDLTGLPADTAFEYELRDAHHHRVDDGSFRTFSAEDGAVVRFAVIGDSGKQPWWVWLQESTLLWPFVDGGWFGPAAAPSAVAACLAEAAPQFWLHVGDVIYPKGEQQHYGSGFFMPFADVLRNSPCVPVLGNHDVMTGNGRPFLQNFVWPPEPDGVTGDGRNFTFRSGPVRVVGLDLNTPVSVSHPSMRYLRSVLENASEPWFVVMSHYPILSVYRERPRPDLAETLVPLMKALGVDLYLAGHDHNYQRFHEPGADDGPVQLVTGGGGKDLYDVRRAPDELVVAERAHHWTEVVVEGPRMRVTARDVGGKILDEFVIDKALLAKDGRVSVGRNPPREQRIRALLR